MIPLKDLIQTKTISNIVAKFEVIEKIDFTKISKSFSNVKIPMYGGRAIFLVVPYEEKNITYIISETGKIRAIGLKSIEDFNNCAIYFINLMKEHGIFLKLKRQSMVTNINVLIDTKQTINLQHMILKLENFSYEPEIFPGIIYKKEINQSITYLIFSSGKIVIVGLKTFDSIDSEIDFIYKKLN
jgi:TATA-box binding protein (TBP) (component of TFIID and TFIIIB)